MTFSIPADVRLFRIRYCWRRGVKEFRASTIWGVRGTPSDALKDFIARNPKVISCHVQEELEEFAP